MVYRRVGASVRRVRKLVDSVCPLRGARRCRERKERPSCETTPGRQVIWSDKRWEKSLKKLDQKI